MQPGVHRILNLRYWLSYPSVAVLIERLEEMRRRVRPSHVGAHIMDSDA